MRPIPTLLLAAALAVGVSTGAAPATAAPVPPSVEVIGAAATVEGAYVSIIVEYRCSPGSRLRLQGALRQSGAPTALYDSTATTAYVPELTCDGTSRITGLGLVLRGWTAEGPASRFAYLRDTASGGALASAVIVLTAPSGPVAADHSRLPVEAR